MTPSDVIALIALVLAAIRLGIEIRKQPPPTGEDGRPTRSKRETGGAPTHPPGSPPVLDCSLCGALAARGIIDAHEKGTPWHKPLSFLPPTSP